MLQLNRSNKYSKANSNVKHWDLFAGFFFLLLFVFPSSASQSNVNKAKHHQTKITTPIAVNAPTFSDYLNDEKKHLLASIAETQQEHIPKDAHEYELEISQISAITTMIRVKIENLAGFLEQQNKEQTALNQRLKYLQQLPIIKEGSSIQDRVARVETLLELNKNIIQLIKEDMRLAQQFQAALDTKTTYLHEWNTKYNLEQKLIDIKSNKEQLNRELSALYLHNIVDKTGKKNAVIIAVNTDYEAELLVNNQNISAIHTFLNAYAIYKNIVKADIAYLKNSDTKSLQAITETHKDALNQYTYLEKTIVQIQAFLNNETDLIKSITLKNTVKKLQLSLTDRLKTMQEHKQLIHESLNHYQIKLKHYISSRQSLAEYNLSTWPIIVKKIAAIPNLIYKYVKTLALKVYDSYLWLTISSVVVLWTAWFVLISLFSLFNYFLKYLQVDKERSSFTGYLYNGLLIITKRNVPCLCILSMLLVLLYITHISFTNYQLFLQLIGIWFTFRVVNHCARLALLERISDSSGTDVKLYYRLKWLLLFGGWTTALMTIGHLLPLSILLQDIFNRLFMLFILTVSLVAWKSKDVIRYLVRPLLTDKKSYVYNAISLLIFLVPITLFTTAIIGLSGFTNLAWTMSQYQANALLVLVGYILIRGFLFDALDLFSKWMISSLRNGWLWTEVFLKPIDRILRVILLICCCLTLTTMYGWNSDSVVMINFSKLIQYPIVNLPGIHITIISTVAFICLVFLFIWAAKWTREFCFRWLYQNVKDAGIRHSLSVFSQYAIVLIGSVVTLHTLGFDFTGMSMIIGGLAVGLGFGLRDFASNIVGGIMILIERTVREGDLVTIGEHEGRVAHIGIRCMRVSSWDNMEVLIPNSETFNKSFTNWTHQDSIVRSIVPIKVSRADDPIMIQQLILDVLAIIPEIVPDPPVQVCLKNIDTGLIEFEARYFINVQIHSRFEIQSKVLFAITAQFKAANVKPPIEPIAIEFKEKHAEFVARKESSSK